MTETAERHFTVAEADATLPLVRRIVHDLIDLHPRWRAAVSTFEGEQLTPGGETESDSSKAARIEAGRLAGEIETCLDELEQVGCIFKGFDVGLVDFPSLMAGREVYLCWQYDEPRVDFWHEIDDGFLGRQPLDPFLFSLEGP
jgi:hypothetical protein